MARREYEDRYISRDGLSRGPSVRTRERDVEDIEIYSRREVDRDRQPAFLREEFVRVEDQPLVLRERKVETLTRPAQRRSPSPERIRTRIIERERSPSPRPAERIRTRVIERERSPEPERVRTRVVEREREREREPSVERVRTTTRTVERERERERSPRDRLRTRIVEREREKSRHRSPSPNPIIRVPSIHQEVITHHRHIDHGYEYAAPPTPRQRHEKETEIDIYRGSRGDTEIDIQTSKRSVPRRDEYRSKASYDDDILIERDHNSLRVRETHNAGRRSVSSQRVPIGNESEAEYYARRAMDRAYIHEGHNGATRDWTIVDVPPGTERVRMDGVGGGSQEITWQKYNGVRRSRFIPERDVEYEREEISDRRMARRNREMWTEITKDLVLKEAIEDMGYDYEETEYFFYIIQYLRQEDIQELVHISDDIRRDRHSRVREIEIERERFKEERRPIYDDERVIEREIVYEAPGRRSRTYLH